MKLLGRNCLLRLQTSLLLTQSLRLPVQKNLQQLLSYLPLKLNLKPLEQNLKLRSQTSLLLKRS